MAGYGDKAATKSVKLAGDFGGGVEGGSSPSDNCWDSPPETLRAGDSWPMITRSSRSCARFDLRLLEILRPLKPWKFLRRSRTSRPQSCESWPLRSIRATSRTSRGRCATDDAAARPGRDFAGVVEAGPSEWIGAEVWGTGGDTGFTRDGTHAELIAVPVASLRRKPKTLSFDEAASVGVTYVAAWCGIEAAGLKPGETQLLIGAGGGVGSAAAQIARRLGARVIGADRRAPLPNADSSLSGDADRRRRGPAGGGSRGDRGQGRGRCPRSGRRRHVPQRPQLPRLARQAGRNRRDRAARSEF